MTLRGLVFQGLSLEQRVFNREAQSSCSRSRGGRTILVGQLGPNGV